MTQEGQILPPPVIWAQRNNILFVTICLEDCKDPTIIIEADKIYFKGIGGTEKKMHEITVNLYKEIEPDKTVQSPKGRNFEMLLFKKENGPPFWPRLTKENKRFHWLKSDFNKWLDEDDSEDESKSKDLKDLLHQFGNVRGDGNLDGLDSKPNFDDLDIDEEEIDSDEEYSENQKNLTNRISYKLCKKNYDSEDEVMGFSNEEYNDENDKDKDSIISDIEDFEHFNLPNEKAWGKKKKSYYFTDYIDADYFSVSQKDIAGAELEEKEARNLQKHLIEYLNETDFGIDQISEYNQIDECTQQVKTDLSQLSKRQKEELIKKESPELIFLITDFHERLLESKIILDPLLKFLNNVNYENYFTITFTKTKYNLLLHYCINISFYLMLKAKKQIIFIHPVIKRLAQYRKLISQFEKSQENILDKIKIKSNKNSQCLYNFLDHNKIANNKLNQTFPKNLDCKNTKNFIIDVGKRAITSQIGKNKGLVPHRKKEQRNPRVKHRNKYRRAKIHRKGAIREIRKENNKYKGEISGIKASVKKSIKIK
ncbi:PREDICTED: something about silencing protein 10-like [Ceratosolen solmsi marchali]|uniref:Something about silencing protein 10-like n=1 Tax=Ceratosolen solmsi marchali TaxID=326594 RepID=A0AAJ6YQY8_9HYME|nr:PREDICTED: something about silencing protein 10-like [Ceratosolen solmsi marchali]